MGWVESASGGPPETTNGRSRVSVIPAKAGIQERPFVWKRSRPGCHFFDLILHPPPQDRYLIMLNDNYRIRGNHERETNLRYDVGD